MKIFIAILASSIFLSSFSYQSNAALIDTDLIVEGDSFLLLDTTTGLDWLDLRLTLNKSYNEVQALLQPGGAYDGFRNATINEVQLLWTEANITDTNWTWVNNGEYLNVKILADRLGTSPLLSETGFGTHALGLVEGGPLLPANERWVMEISYHFNGVDVRTSSNHYTFDIDISSEHYSSYLVRDTLPDGDLNFDGLVNAGDVLIATRIALGLITANPAQMLRGDVAPLISGNPTPDGVINAADVLVIQNKAFGLISFP